MADAEIKTINDKLDRLQLTLAGLLLEYAKYSLICNSENYKLLAKDIAIAVAGEFPKASEISFLCQTIEPIIVSHLGLAPRRQTVSFQYEDLKQLAEDEIIGEANGEGE